MDVQAGAPAITGAIDPTTATATAQEVTSAQDAAQVPSSTASVPASSSTTEKPVNETTIARAVAKLYNVSAASGEPQTLSVSYKYVSELHLVVTVFSNPETGEEVAQFPPQELIGLAEFFDQIDGVTLDQRV